MARPPRVPNWLPWEARTIYFITICVEDRKSVLAEPRTWEICRDVFAKLDQWRILCAIVMPDHLHMIAAPLNRDASVSDFVKWFKRWFKQAYRVSTCWSSPSDGDEVAWRWQQGCFDRLLRPDESLAEKVEYLRQNPVRVGLVENPADWPYQLRINEEDL